MRHGGRGQAGSRSWEAEGEEEQTGTPRQSFSKVTKVARAAAEIRRFRGGDVWRLASAMATGKDMDMGNEGEGKEGLGREPTASEVRVSVNSGAAATLSCELTAAGSGANTRSGRGRTTCS